MNKKEAIQEIKEKYDIKALDSVLRFSEKNPDRFEWDDNKEYVDIDDILEAFVCVKLHKYNDFESSICENCKHNRSK